MGGGGAGTFLPSLSLHSPHGHHGVATSTSPHGHHGGGGVGGGGGLASSPSRISPRSPVSNCSTGSAESGERYSRKVFVGGLPPDIDEGFFLFLFFFLAIFHRFSIRCRAMSTLDKFTVEWSR